MAPFLMYARRDLMTPAVLRDGLGVRVAWWLRTPGG